MSIRTVVFRLTSTSPYSQSRPHNTPKLEGERDDDWEKRTWKERLHVEGGEVVIPAMAIKNCLDSAAKFLSKKIPGGGRKTYTKVIESGIMIVKSIVIASIDDVIGEELFLNADGRRGGGTRVWRTYPRIDSWVGDVELTVLNPALKDEILEEHMVAGGRYIGIGRFRAENRGYYGRYKAEILETE